MTLPTPFVHRAINLFLARTIKPKARQLGLIALTFTLMSAGCFAANTDRVTAAHLMSNLSASSWIQEGDGSKIIYVFFDPNCPYCHNVYDSLVKIRKTQPDLQYRWVPLAMLGGTSLGKAAAIIQAPNPLVAFHQSERNYGFLDNDTGGGIQPIKNITNATKLMLDENLSIIQGENLAGIPVVVFQATDGKPFYFMGQRTQTQLQELLAFVASGNFGGGTAIKPHK
jgi:thiol:disulfide interchange protein DsbG